MSRYNAKYCKWKSYCEHRTLLLLFNRIEPNHLFSSRKSKKQIYDGPFTQWQGPRTLIANKTDKYGYQLFSLQALETLELIFSVSKRIVEWAGLTRLHQHYLIYALWRAFENLDKLFIRNGELAFLCTWLDGKISGFRSMKSIFIHFCVMNFSRWQFSKISISSHFGALYATTAALQTSRLLCW